MSGDVDIASAAAALADPTRVRFLLALGNATGRTAGELAAAAGVGRSAASFHLAKLLDAGLVAATTRGRHRVYRLTSPLVPEVLELLAALSAEEPVSSLRQAVRAEQVKIGRLCEHHMGGFLGVRITMTLRSQGLLVDEANAYRLTDRGLDVLSAAGLDLDEFGRGSRHVERHPDWSEKSHHMAGELARTLTGFLLDRAWIARHGGDRALKVTPAGLDGLRETIGADLARPRIGQAAEVPTRACASDPAAGCGHDANPVRS